MSGPPKSVLLLLGGLWALGAVAQIPDTGADSQSLQTTNTSGHVDQDISASSAAELEIRVDNLAMQGRLEEAERLVNRALEIHPNHSGLQASASTIHILRSIGADPLLPAESELMDLEPNTAAQPPAVPPVPAEALSLERRIDGLIIQGRLDEAQKLLDRALTDFPEYEGLHASQSMLSLRRSLRTWGNRGLWFFGIFLAVFASIILALLKRRPLTAASAYVFGVYLLALPAALLIAIAGVGVAEMAKSEQLPSYFEHAALVIFSCFLGAVGGAIDSSVILANRERHLIPGSGQFAYFFFKPLNGFYLAGAMYFALLAGNIAVFDDSAGMPTTWTVGLLATLTGIFSENAIEKLRQVSSSLFGTVEIPKRGAALSTTDDAPRESSAQLSTQAQDVVPPAATA